MSYYVLCICILDWLFILIYVVFLVFFLLIIVLLLSFLLRRIKLNIYTSRQTYIYTHTVDYLVHSVVGKNESRLICKSWSETIVGGEGVIAMLGVLLMRGSMLKQNYFNEFYFSMEPRLKWNKLILAVHETVVAANHSINFLSTVIARRRLQAPPGACATERSPELRPFSKIISYHFRRGSVLK